MGGGGGAHVRKKLCLLLTGPAFLRRNPLGCSEPRRHTIEAEKEPARGRGSGGGEDIGRWSRDPSPQTFQGCRGELKLPTASLCEGLL